MSVKVIKICKLEMEEPHKFHREYAELERSLGLAFEWDIDNYCHARRILNDYLEAKIREALDDV